MKYIIFEWSRIANPRYRILENECSEVVKGFFNAKR